MTITCHHPSPRTIGFLPDYYVNDRSVAAKRSMKRTGIGTVRAASVRATHRFAHALLVGVMQ